MIDINKINVGSLLEFRLNGYNKEHYWLVLAKAHFVSGVPGRKDFLAMRLRDLFVDNIVVFDDDRCWRFVKIT